jgi:hypothetical protein
MSFGIDSQFGYGGEIVGYGAYGQRYNAEIEGSFAERTARQIEDSFKELGAFLTGGSYASAAEIAGMQSLDQMRNDAIAGLNGVGFDKNAEALNRANEAINQNVGDRFGDTLDNLNPSTLGWGGSTTGYTTSEADQRNRSTSSFGGYDGGVGRDSDGVGGFGGDGTVICTALSKHGVFTKKELKEQFSYTLKTHSKETIRAYHRWAGFFVSKINDGKQVKFWSFVMKHRANEILYRTGKRASPDLIGKISILFVDGGSMLYAFFLRAKT